MSEVHKMYTDILNCKPIERIKAILTLCTAKLWLKHNKSMVKTSFSWLVTKLNTIDSGRCKNYLAVFSHFLTCA